ncbi:MAG: class I SAM-dependent methyltransferase [Candidatus Omnitrophica bacterium]|nr:class I SAM-dependent methyltransferase [Candidatus Omnitrophota bacterium]
MEQMDYFINQPVFLKYKRGFDLKRMRRKAFIKSATLNERVIEIPFAIKQISAMPAPCRVLDVGCMESELPLFMAGLGYDVTGFDFRHYPCRVPNFRFVQGDILDLPFDDNSYDAVTCISTIEHIGIGFYNDPKGMTSEPDIKAMAQISRVLKPQGLLVLTVPFGIFCVNKHQRVYDTPAVKRLLSGFKIESAAYYKNTKPALANNYWKEISCQEADSVDCRQAADCVACISALNRKK